MEKIGLIVGNGKFPLYFIKEAKNSNISVYPIGLFPSVDDEIKKKAERTFDDIGISMSAAINIYLKTVVRENRIPFELSADPFYSDENMSRLRESIRQVRDGEKKLTEHEIIEV